MGHSHLFAVLVALSVFAFAASCFARFRLVAVGSADRTRLTPFWTRVGQMLLYAIAQKRVVARPFGVNHVAIFWSFLVLMLANAEFVVSGAFPSVGFHRLPLAAQCGLGLLFDAVSLLTLAAIATAVGRRLLFPPDYMEARSRDAFIILGLIAALMVAFFGAGASAIATGAVDPQLAAWKPVSRAIAGLAGDALGEGALTGFWWAHAAVLLAFLNYLPHSKHMHILTAIPNCYLRSLGKVNTLPREEFEAGRAFGGGRVDRLSWKDLFDSFSCTECGRCTDVCPAYRTGQPLNPRLVVHDIKINLLENGPAMRRGESPARPLIGGPGAEAGEGTVAEAAIWSCTTCGACMEACPVLIEQMPKILKMRRDLVEMQARFPPELLNLFENMEQRGNPWGIAPSERTKWCANIQTRPFSGETEYLFFVGCAGAFDARTKQVSLAVSALLDAAGVSWGLLGRDEWCCGDSLRRLGNEYAFDQMARRNVELFRARGVRKIVTICPHCFSTLKNDYRAYGIELEVLHHSELIDQLVASGRLPRAPKAGYGRLVYHDPCYLGRHNDVYDAPRRVIAAAAGSAPVELKRCRENSFCCGAGGGGMWMEQDRDTRINVARVTEALDAHAQTICVSCPYCLLMFEDGLKTKSEYEHVRVKDVAELMAESLAASRAGVAASPSSGA